jgi:cytochrome c oxidase subunit IV
MTSQTPDELMAHVDTGQSFLQAKAHNPANVHAQGHTHVVPPKILFGTFAALLVLTVLTVAVTLVDLGPLNIWIALLVAVVKAALVALYFMHLRWDAPFNALILVSALFFVAIMIGTTILDTKEYKPNYDPPRSGQSMSGSQP